MQGPLNLADAEAEVMPYWSKVWKDPVPIHHRPHGYIDAGLPYSQPDCLSSVLVRRVLRRRMAGRKECERPLQIAIVSSMCWLHSAGSAGLESLLRDGSVSFDHDGLFQSLDMIRKALAAFDMYMAC